MMKAEFAFSINQVVKTILGDKGIVDMAAINNSGEECYYVKLKGGQGEWFNRDQLA